MNKSQKRNLDQLWSKVIRLRDGYCRVCKNDNVNAHHIFSRSRMNTRWDVNNGIGVCAGCHTFSSILSAHKTPRAFFRWLEENLGKKFIDDLEVRSQMIAKGLDYKLIKLDLENELNKLT